MLMANKENEDQIILSSITLANINSCAAKPRAGIVSLTNDADMVLGKESGFVGNKTAKL